jgi:hypothetical protein
MNVENIFTVRTLRGRLTSTLMVTALMLAFCLISVPTIAQAKNSCKAKNLCKSTAQNTRISCGFEGRADYRLACAKCDNLADPEERKACKQEAQEELTEKIKECQEQYNARVELCDDLGPDPYDPEINPVDFMDIDVMIANPNPYVPLIPGWCRTYEGETDEGTETIEVCVTDDTREILGVNCMVVRDTVTLDGELTEDTFDYFAQDLDGNLWYFGENSYGYEDDRIVSVEGSWIAGVDGAKAGIIMYADPQIGDLYRQEFLPGEAEDMAEVLALDKAVSVPYGNFENCVMTKDFTPIEPDLKEHKYYAKDVGVVLEVNVETGERVELVDVHPITP